MPHMGMHYKDVWSQVSFQTLMYASPVLLDPYVCMSSVWCSVPLVVSLPQLSY